MKDKYLLKELSDTEFIRLIRAEAEIAECEGCTGECRKRCPDYFVPVISSNGGKVEFDCKRCEFYQPPVQPQKISEIVQATPRWLEEFQAELEERRIANRKQHLQRVLKQYGLAQVSDAELSNILYAEKQNAECELCNGKYCRKGLVHDQYQRYEVAADGSTIKVPCAVELQNRAERNRKKLRQCMIPAKYFGKTFADYEVNGDNARAVKMAKWFIKEVPDRWLYFYGECGTGKTFLVAIVAQNFLQSGKSVVFGDVPALMEELKRTFDSKNGDSSQDVLDRYKGCDLLVLDDIGAGQISEWNIGILYQLINDRYVGGKSTLITSNFDLDGLEARLKSKDSYSAKRIVSRISEMCEVGFLGNVDRRPAMKSQEVEAGT